MAECKSILITSQIYGFRLILSGSAQPQPWLYFDLKTFNFMLSASEIKFACFFSNWLYVFLHLTWWVLAGANENYDIKTMQWHHHFVTMETSWLGIKGSSAPPGKRGQHIIPVWWWSKYRFGFNHPYYLSILLKCNNLLYLVWIRWSLQLFKIVFNKQYFVYFYQIIISKIVFILQLWF